MGLQSLLVRNFPLVLSFLLNFGANLSSLKKLKSCACGGDITHTTQGLPRSAHSQHYAGSDDIILETGSSIRVSSLLSLWRRRPRTLLHALDQSVYIETRAHREIWTLRPLIIKLCEIKKKDPRWVF